MTLLLIALGFQCTALVFSRCLSEGCCNAALVALWAHFIVQEVATWNV